MPPTPAPADKSADKLVNLLADTIAPKVRDPEVLAWLWSKVEEELRAFDAHNETELFPGLNIKNIRGLCAELDNQRLERALYTAFSKIWAEIAPPAADPSRSTDRSAKASGKLSGKKRGRTGAVSAGKRATKLELASATAPAGDIGSEFNQLSPFVRQNVIGGISAWPGLRVGMFATFGASNNASVAISRINLYYAKLREANFPPVASVPGRKSPVHPDLKAKLDAAVTLLNAKGQAAALASLKSAGGFAIRKNANDPSKLSNHSFGWALDLDPAFNPNIGKNKLPLDLIQKITGIDLYGAESTRLRSARPYAATLADVTALSDASKTFVAAFKNMAALKTACGRAITRLYRVTLNAATVDQAFATASDAALRTLLSGAGIPAAKVNECAKFVKDAIAQLKLAQGPGISPAIMGTSASVTKFGFFNMPPPLIAALVASDGAGLFWLGTANNTKDYMHSELVAANQPDLF